MTPVFRLLTFSLALFCATATAAPTAQVAGGGTAVALSDDFVAALASLGVDAAPVRPARVTPRGTVRFPIPGGALDLATARGDVFHTGGLTLSAGATEVQLLNFVIDTTDTPVLTGLVAVNGDILGRVPLFNLELTMAPEVTNNRRLIIAGVNVTLTDAAAGALNGVFNVGAFTGGFNIGEAKLRTRLTRLMGDGADDDGDDSDSDSDSDSDEH